METDKQKEAQNTESTSKKPQGGDEEGDGFEVEEIHHVEEKLSNVNLDSNKGENTGGDTKLKTGSKAFDKPEGEKSKLVKSDRVFKPKEKPKEEAKEKTKLSNTGKTFVPPKRGNEEAKGGQYAGAGYQEGYNPQYQGYGGFDEGAPEYLEDPDLNDVEDDFLKFQYQNEQLEVMENLVGDFGEGLIRFEESSRNCECCQGLVERCDGEICQTLGECYCVSHNQNANKA